MKRHSTSSDADGILDATPSPTKRKSVECPNFECNASELKDVRFPTFQQPVEVGCFSVDADNTVHEDDARHLAQYIGNSNTARPSHRDLNEGLQFWNRKPVQAREGEDLFVWIQRKLNSDPNFTTPNFVCFRGLLTRLLCFPYEQRERLRIAAIRLGHTCYLCRFETPEKLEKLKHETADQRRFSYWGYRFEKYMTHYPGKNEARSVRNEEYASVVRTKLEEFSLLYAGEVDCAIEWKGKREYVELKTHRSLYHTEEEHGSSRLRTYARRNLLHWWSQSFLLNISRVVVGFRNDEGIVELISEQNTSELYQNAKKLLVTEAKNECWRPNVCFNYLLRFLRHVQEVMPDGTPSDEVFVFTFSHNQPTTCEVFDNSSQYYFLPDYILTSRLATR